MGDNHVNVANDHIDNDNDNLNGNEPVVDLMAPYREMEKQELLVVLERHIRCLQRAQATAARATNTMQTMRNNQLTEQEREERRMLGDSKSVSVILQ